jgi:repressor LexA
MPPVLSPKQKRLLDYLRRRIQRNGGAPSLRQAAGDLGVSHAAVAQGLRILEEKGYLRREGRYSRSIYLLNPRGEAAGLQRWREVPVVGRITAGLPIYAQQEWEGSLVLDADVFRGRDLFALRVRGDSMRDAGILDGDLAVCEPRQYAADGEIVVALIDGEEATVKHFFRHPGHIELRPANSAYMPMRYGFSQVLVQGKVVGLQRSVA